MEGCGNYGIPVLDTTGARIRVYYFPIGSDGIANPTAYNEVMRCVGASGWRKCLHLAQTWLDQPIG